jgi:hypothetical protein
MTDITPVTDALWQLYKALNVVGLAAHDVKLTVSLRLAVELGALETPNQVCRGAVIGGFELECPEANETLKRMLQEQEERKAVKFTDCPHAAPFRYCDGCKVSPCPIGLGGALKKS